LAKKRKKLLNKEMRSQVKGILLIALAVFSFIGIIMPEQAGSAGIYVNMILKTLAGEAAVVIPFFIVIFALRMILPQNKINVRARFFGLLVLQLLFMIWAHLQLIAERIPFISADNLFFESILLGLGGEGGGVIGALFAGALFFLFGYTGSRILVGTVALISVLLIFNISLKRTFNMLFNFLSRLYAITKTTIKASLSLMGNIGSAAETRLNDYAAAKSSAKPEIPLAESSFADSADLIVEQLPVPKNEEMYDSSSEDYQKERSLAVEEYRREEKSPAAPKDLPAETDAKVKKPMTGYIYPTLDLLSLPVSNEEPHHLRNSRDRAKLLESTLLSFGVRAKVIHVQSGPTVTRFEVQPEAGVKVSKIISLSDDLALNLAAPLVRIEAPIPGKAALGIEVPNKIISLVYIREVMDDLLFRKSVSPLTVGLGKDITGISVVADLTKMPHLLIAGATGAGKSVCLNTIITSILYKAGPDQVRFLMIDPKVVELSVYNGIPHLLMPVVTDPRKASLALRNMVREMARRYDLFAGLGVRDIGAYNDLAAENEELEKLSFIVVVIDELADLMMVSPGEVEDSIARLAQMSRAAGIHLLVATQRPSVDVLTGVIKANITSRIAFTVSSQFDSRTILDMSGAEKLLGRGDMLFYPVGSVKPFRVQGAYVSEVEVKKITDFIKEQGRVEYEKAGTFLETADEPENEETDALFPEAVDLVVRTGSASISLLQRRFRIGYTRAARLIDDLERRAVVGPFEGSKPREVLVTAEQAARICEDFNSQPD
jgi:DNA segregation ATPase FtsK/SpoIIIE, S-DNA-T family